MQTGDIGILAEEYVAQYLNDHGYTVLDKNWRKPWGELDIVAEKNGVICFVEVKSGQKNHISINPEVHANHEKIRKVVLTARTWLAYRKRPPEQEWQIDIASVILNERGLVESLRYFENIDV